MIAHEQLSVVHYCDSRRENFLQGNFCARQYYWSEYADCAPGGWLVIICGLSPCVLWMTNLGKMANLCKMAKKILCNYDGQYHADVRKLIMLYSLCSEHPSGIGSSGRFIFFHTSSTVQGSSGFIGQTDSSSRSSAAAIWACSI